MASKRRQPSSLASIGTIGIILLGIIASRFITYKFGFIYAKRDEGMGTERIAKQLNEEGIPTKRNGNWTGTMIHGIIKNEKYTGDVLLQKTFTDENFDRKVNQGELDQYLIENHHEAITSHEEFDSANQMFEYQESQKNVAIGSRKYLNRYPFSGRIKCAECGDIF